jgi:PmbA protein
VSNQLFNDGVAEEIAAGVIAHARRLGLSAAVGVNAGEGLSLSVRNRALETLEHHRDKSLGVTVYQGHQKGSASTTDFSAESLAETLAAAARIARFAEADQHAGLIAPNYLATSVPKLDLDHPWSITVEEATTLALTCEDAARTAEREVSQVDDSGLTLYRGLHAYADTQGFIGSYTASRHSLNCTVVGTRAGAMQRGYWYSTARDAAALEDPVVIGKLASARAVAKLGARKLSTRRAPVLFEARIATGLIGHLVAAISGGNLYREASFLRDAAGTQILPSFLHIDEDPHLLRGLGSAPFDSEGAATSARRLIDAGVLTGYVLDGYSARRLQLAPTGNAGGIHNLIVSDQGADYVGLVKQMDTGLIVTDLMGFGVNLLTGDYSRGASGFWVERGEIAYPVEEITIAGNLRDMFQAIVATGTDREVRSSVRTGSILLAEMTIAGD